MKHICSGKYFHLMHVLFFLEFLLTLIVVMPNCLLEVRPSYLRREQLRVILWLWPCMLALIPMITKFSNTVKQMWYVDDAAAAGLLTDLCTWWDMLCGIGPPFGYFVNSSKTFLIVKVTHLPMARAIFEDTAWNSIHYSG